MSQLPRVSVLIPNYNYARFLEQRFQSIWNQTFQDFEIVYLDDASSDNSAEVFASCARECEKRGIEVRTIQNERNGKSAFKQWNKGVLAARGELIWIAEADDFCEPALLETLVGLLDQNPRAVLAYCGSMFVDENGAKTGRAEAVLEPISQRWKTDFRNNGRDECRNYLVNCNTILNASAVVFRRQEYLAIGGANEKQTLNADWLTWAKMLLRGDVVYHAEPLNYFRRHAQTVRSTTDPSRRVLENVLVTEHILRKVELPLDEQQRVLDFLALSWIEAQWPPFPFAASRKRSVAALRAAKRLDPNFFNRLPRRFPVFAKNLMRGYAHELRATFNHRFK